MQVTEKTAKYVETLGADLSSVLKHDFLSKTQAAYFVEKKNTVGDGEYVVSLDFAENYTFQIQDAIQSHHWSNTQATLHPYVIYYRENGQANHLSFVIISEKLTHDANSVHLFNARLAKYLKKKFGCRNVQKFYYFSDGAGSQYKNKFNFLNLYHHKNDFAIEAEWNFFATSHGKGACDGVGGAVKRLAHKASMQRVTGDHISNPKALYEWARNAFKTIDFDFCSQLQHNAHEKKYQNRLKGAIAIKNTRQYHQFQPTIEKQIQSRIFSKDDSLIKNTISK